VSQSNGDHANGISKDLKRRREDDSEVDVIPKKAKTTSIGDDDDVVVVADGADTDPASGPIVLD
jgi:hypothetical protein